MTVLGKEASKTFGSGISKLPEIDLGKTRGVKPQMVGTT